MEKNFKNFDAESKLTIKELTKNNERFSKLISKLNSVKEDLNKKPELTTTIEQIKK